jgi:hypothetical protein
MSVLEERFRDHFAPWSISIPPGHVGERGREKIVEGGWAIWYLFGEDERGEYLDYYASHRMTNDRHFRLREDGTEEYLSRQIVCPYAKGALLCRRLTGRVMGILLEEGKGGA